MWFSSKLLYLSLLFGNGIFIFKYFEHYRSISRQKRWVHTHMSRFNELLFNYLIFYKCQIQKNYDALINKNKNCQINDSHLQKCFTLNNNVIYIKLCVSWQIYKKRNFKGIIFFLAANFISKSSFISWLLSVDDTSHLCN